MIAVSVKPACHGLASVKHLQKGGVSAFPSVAAGFEFG